MKCAVVRFYFDADILGVGKVVAGLRPDATFPGDAGAVFGNMHRDACPIADSGAKDVIWLPEVAHRGWLIVTRDAKLTRRRAEVAAILEHGARVFVIASREALTIWMQLEVLMRRWQDIERISETQAGPYAYALTMASARPIEL